LTGGQIAGIVIGAILGALALLALIIFGCVLLRKRRSNSPATSIFNQPATMKQIQPEAKQFDGARDSGNAGLAVPPANGRVARMSALEGNSSASERDDHSPAYAVGGYRRSTSSDSGHESDTDTPASRNRLEPPQTGKRSGSLARGPGTLVADQQTSPSTDFQTSPESGGRSEQLAFFKDYYSQSEIHSLDIVSTLWAYEPRAADEFHLERGDMIKVIGIWDDGWATGVRVRGKAEDWRPEDKMQRDSGMTTGSSGNGTRSTITSEGEGEVKAFPMVCVCLPQFWRRTVEGDSTEGSGPFS
jgi:hypothetical protein